MIQQSIIKLSKDEITKILERKLNKDFSKAIVKLSAKGITITEPL